MKLFNKMENKLKYEVSYNKVIFRDDEGYKKGFGTYYILDYIFAEYWPEHLTHKNKKQGSRFAGATGSEVRIITDEEIANFVENYDVEDLWKQAVEGGGYVGGLDEYTEELRLNGEIENMAYEEAPVHCYDAIKATGITLKDSEHLDYVGGGRCFDAKKMIKGRNAKDIEIYDLPLYDFIISIEYGLDEELEEAKHHWEIEKESLTRNLTRDKDLTQDVFKDLRKEYQEKLSKVENILRHIQGLQKALKTIK